MTATCEAAAIQRSVESHPIDCRDRESDRPVLVINGLEPGTQLKKGDLVKQIVAGSAR